MRMWHGRYCDSDEHRGQAHFKIKLQPGAHKRFPDGRHSPELAQLKFELGSSAGDGKSVLRQR